MAENQNVTFKIGQSGVGDSHFDQLVDDYIKKIRDKPAHVAGGAKKYDDEGGDQHDSHKDTVHVIALKNGKVVGGLRIIIRKNGTDTEMKTEVSGPVRIRHTLSHLSDPTYAEISGVSVDENERGQGISWAMLAETYRYLKEETDYDIIIVEPIPKRIKDDCTALEDAGVAQIQMVHAALMPVEIAQKKYGFPSTGQEIVLTTKNSPEPDVETKERLKQYYKYVTDPARAFESGSANLNYTLVMYNPETGEDERFVLVPERSADGHADSRIYASFKPDNVLPLLSPQMRDVLQWADIPLIPSAENAEYHIHVREQILGYEALSKDGIGRSVRLPLSFSISDVCNTAIRDETPDVRRQEIRDSQPLPLEFDTPEYA